MAKYVGFGSKDLNTSKNDVNDARELAQRCTKALLYRLGGPIFTTQKLLSNTFMISPREWEIGKNWDKAGKLRDRFSLFWERMQLITCTFSAKSPTEPGEMELGAFVRSNVPNVIYLTPRYFKITTQKKPFCNSNP